MSDLFKRLREHAACHADIAKFNKEQAQWERDLITAADRLELAEALLREAADGLDVIAAQRKHVRWPLCDRIDAFLSPDSARVALCKICGGTGREPVMISGEWGVAWGAANCSECKTRSP